MLWLVKPGFEYMAGVGALARTAITSAMSRKEILCGDIREIIHNPETDKVKVLGNGFKSISAPRSTKSTRFTIKSANTKKNFLVTTHYLIFIIICPLLPLYFYIICII